MAVSFTGGPEFEEFSRRISRQMMESTGLQETLDRLSRQIAPTIFEAAEFTSVLAKNMDAIGKVMPVQSAGQLLERDQAWRATNELTLADVRARMNTPAAVEASDSELLMGRAEALLLYVLAWVVLFLVTGYLHVIASNTGESTPPVLVVLAAEVGIVVLWEARKRLP